MANNTPWFGRKRRSDTLDDVQEIIHEMVQIINDPAADENEKNAAADTLLEALFPSNHQGTLGIGTPIARERELLEEHKRLYGKLPRCNERIG